MSPKPRTESDLMSMPFTEHLEELRVRLIRVLLVLGAVFFVSLAFQHELLAFLAGPHSRAMRGLEVELRYRKFDKHVSDLEAALKAVEPADGAVVIGRSLRGQEEWELEWQREAAALSSAEPRDRLLVRLKERMDVLARNQDPYLALGDDLTQLILSAERMLSESGENDHMLEARDTLKAIPAILEGWKTSSVERGERTTREILSGVLLELERARTQAYEIEHTPPEAAKLIMIRYTEGFFTYMKVCLLFALLVAVPWLLYEGWSFVAAGLYVDERKAVAPFLPISLFALVLGFVFGYFVLVPVGLAYLGSYGDPSLVQGTFVLKEYVSLASAMLLGMGLLFQLPLIMVFLSRAGMVSTSWFRENRKFSILGGLVLSAMLTPPDVVTQVLMAGPLVLLYETGIQASAFFDRRAGRAAGGSPDDDAETEADEA